MTKKLFIFMDLMMIALAACAFILSLAIYLSTYLDTNNDPHLYNRLNANSQMNGEKTEQIDNEKALQLNGLNNEINQFMIYEFKNTYRVKA